MIICTYVTMQSCDLRLHCRGRIIIIGLMHNNTMHYIFVFASCISVVVNSAHTLQLKDSKGKNILVHPEHW